ncbi:MAG: cobalamin B12-binding domain-containing protein [Candidatus Humimicrobiaceae bacterium]
MKKILGATAGSCIHVAGIISFLKIAENIGFETKFLGSAIDTKTLIREIESFKPEIVGISYRLSPESAVEIFLEFKNALNESALSPVKENILFMLGTTKPVSEALEKAGILNIFKYVFTGGESTEKIKSCLMQENLKNPLIAVPPQNLIDRIYYKTPFPLLRHHFGRPDFNETVKGIKIISESQLIDIISIGPDQNTQEFFFAPERMDHKQDGAGGVPIRSEEDFKKLFIASRTGNYPLLRCYSGTNDIKKMADVLLRNINNAWCAVPLCWYNELDNRSSRTLEESIYENQSVMAWHAQRNIPVEVNESHHWSLRYSSDSIAVAAAYLAAYNAKKMGVKNYVSQYMFNTPPETSFTMDLAKMLAKIHLIESLHDNNFYSWRETRTGLYSMSGDFNKNKGQLASSALLQMQIKPAIIHVVAYCESEYAAKPEDIIESSLIVSKVIENCLNGCPNMKPDSDVLKRTQELTDDALLIIKRIKQLDYENKFEDPLASPEIIGMAIRTGILDAPHLKGVKAAFGKSRTMFFNGANFAVDINNVLLSEESRLESLKKIISDC